MREFRFSTWKCCQISTNALDEFRISVYNDVPKEQIPFPANVRIETLEDFATFNLHSNSIKYCCYQEALWYDARASENTAQKHFLNEKSVLIQI